MEKLAVLRRLKKGAEKKFPVVFRFVWSFVYNKDWFVLKRSSDVFVDIHETDFWGSDESKSGPGSDLAATTTIRRQLPLLFTQYGIQSMLDVPCGDYNWMKEVPKTCDYTGGDVVPAMIERNQRLYGNDRVRFKQIDITADALPKVDLIFCKDCLQHLSYAKVQAALDNFKRSGSKYLLVSSYPKTLRNYDIHDGAYRPLNLLRKPFKLSKPLLQVKEESKAPGVECDKTMYLFRLHEE
jgi:hypothetical protein